MWVTAACSRFIDLDKLSIIAVPTFMIGTLAEDGSCAYMISLIVFKYEIYRKFKTEAVSMAAAGR